jgi:MFS family permease
MPQMFWTGMSIAVYSSLFSVMLNDCIKDDPSKTPDENDKDQDFKTALALVAFGFGEILGCFYIGSIIDKYGSKKAVFGNVLVLIILSAYAIEFILINDYNLLTFITMFLWGV